MKLVCRAPGGMPPQSSNSWFVESTTEWTPSVSIADDPVIAAAPNFATVMPRFAPKAIQMVRGCRGWQRSNAAPVRMPRAPLHASSR
jgi:hypothetical protein